MLARAGFGCVSVALLGPGGAAESSVLPGPEKLSSLSEDLLHKFPMLRRKEGGRSQEVVIVGSSRALA